jgi:hypothetical protein
VWALVDDEEEVAARGARVIWLVPYLPYMSPAEQCRSKIKQLFSEDTGSSQCERCRTFR